MRLAVVVALASLLVLSLSVVGCGEKKTAGEPPVQLGSGPGEKAPATETAPPPPVVETPPPAPTPPVAPVTPKVVEPAKVAPVAARPKTYVVQKNDTLIGLARKFYNDPAKWKDIQSANKAKIPDANVLKAGLEITLP
jgi:nucleoid-associated protein YgaU